MCRAICHEQLLLVFAVVPSAPRDFRARALTSTAIQLTWHAPSSPKGAYVYLITIIVEGDTNVSISEIQLESSLTAYTVDGLEENTFYEFFLIAVTSAGKGERVIARAQTLEARKCAYPVSKLSCKPEDLMF